jgi:hypothetical protein
LQCHERKQLFHKHQTIAAKLVLVSLPSSCPFFILEYCIGFLHTHLQAHILHHYVAIHNTGGKTEGVW